MNNVPLANLLESLTHHPPVCGARFWLADDGIHRTDAEVERALTEAEAAGLVERFWSGEWECWRQVKREAKSSGMLF